MDGVWEIIYLLGAVQGVFITTALFLRKSNQFPNKMLGLLSLFLTLGVFTSYIHETGFFARHPAFYGYTVIIPLFYPIFFHLYILSLTSHVKTWSEKLTIYFSPIFIGIIIIMPFLLLSPEEKEALASPVSLYVFAAFKAIIGLGFSILSLYVYDKYSDNVTDFFSDIKNVQLKWLHFFVFLNVVMWVMFAILFTYTFLKIAYPGWIDGVFYSIETVWLYCIAYIGLRQPEIFYHTSAMVNTLKDKVATYAVSEKEEKSFNDSEKYERNRLDEETLDCYQKIVEEYIYKNKPHRNSTLTLKQLAELTDIFPHHLSQLFNRRYNQNFYTFINTFRIEEVKEKLHDPSYDDRNILAIAYECGFNSKATFNAIFKKMTNFTPSEFRRKSLEKTDSNKSG